MGFTEEIIDKVWEKAQKFNLITPEDYRKDQCSAWIKKSEYGNRNSEFGWEIDHITPQSKGGGDELSNLRPLHWKNNMSKSDGRLVCVITSLGNNNVENVNL